MDEGILFSEISINSKPISKCEMVLECNKRNSRLYVNRNTGGFHACAIEFHSCSWGEKEEDVWNVPDLRVEVLFEAIAYYDGIRHVFFHPNESDLYYPNLTELIKLINKLHEIEQEYKTV